MYYFCVTDGLGLGLDLGLLIKMYKLNKTKKTSEFNQAMFTAFINEAGPCVMWWTFSLTSFTGINWK